MRILVTNDDGIHAPGLESLVEVAKTLSQDIWVVAPETEQSGAGHSLTLHLPLRVRAAGERRFAVSGTPTDCVLLASKVLLPVKEKAIDLVLSGINRSANLADDVTYSGTIAAAMEGTLLGIPSIAISLALDEQGGPEQWGHGLRFLPPLIAQLLKTGWPETTLLNINLPSCLPDAVKGIVAAPQGQRKIGDKIHHRHDPKGRAYYWIGSDREEGRGEAPGCDVAMLREGYITVTPLSLDLTDYKELERLRAALGEYNHAAA